MVANRNTNTPTSRVAMPAQPIDVTRRRWSLTSLLARCELPTSNPVQYGDITIHATGGYGYGSGTPQQQPYTTITSGSIVYVMMPGSGAVAGQVTNGVIVASAAKRFWYHDGILITNSLALTLILLALILM